jgi:hypothetical protein
LRRLNFRDYALVAAFLSSMAGFVMGLMAPLWFTPMVTGQGFGAGNFYWATWAFLLVSMTIGGLIMGWITGALNACILNLLLHLVGGIEIEVEEG